MSWDNTFDLSSWTRDRLVLDELAPFAREHHDRLAEMMQRRLDRELNGPLIVSPEQMVALREELKPCLR